MVAGFLVVAAILTGCGGSAASPDIESPAIQRPDIRTGRADVNAAGDGGSITTSDWTYGLPTSGIVWVDRQGTLHDAGRPECLVPGKSTVVAFAAVEVHVGPSKWRPVVWIRCQ